MSAQESLAITMYNGVQLQQDCNPHFLTTYNPAVKALLFAVHCVLTEQDLFIQRRWV